MHNGLNSQMVYHSGLQHGNQQTHYHYVCSTGNAANRHVVQNNDALVW